MTPHADATEVLAGWDAPTAREDALRYEYLEVLSCGPDALSRGRAAGHLTASALVVDPFRRRMLLTLHRLVGLWLPMGGHCEPTDATLAEVARREAIEESGIEVTVLPGPVLLDRHPVPCRPTGRSVHLDVAYVAVAPEGAIECAGAESLDLQWFPLDEPSPEPTDDAVRRLVKRARARIPAVV